AMAAGIDNARGKILVTMDGDLQNDPTDIPMMVKKLDEGYDIVVGWRHNRQDKMISRKIPSMIANRLIGWVTGVPIKDNGCSLKVYKAEVMQSLPFYSEMHRFIPALLSLSGARVAEVKVKHHARQFGESKYGLSRVYKVLLDLLMIKTILSLVDHPIRWFAKLSIAPFSISILSMIYLVFQFAADAPTIVTVSVVMILFSMGSFLVGLGFLCELVYQRSPMKVDKLALLTAKS
ncbi:MAG: glycosyltransferase, partial [Pseudomonadales bacterium]